MSSGVQFEEIDPPENKEPELEEQEEVEEEKPKNSKNSKNVKKNEKKEDDDNDDEDEKEDDFCASIGIDRFRKYIPKPILSIMDFFSVSTKDEKIRKEKMLSHFAMYLVFFGFFFCFFAAFTHDHHFMNYFAGFFFSCAFFFF